MLINKKLGKYVEPVRKLASNKQHPGLKPNMLVVTNEQPYINPLSLADKANAQAEVDQQNLTASVNGVFDWQPTFSDIANILNRGEEQATAISGFLNNETNKEWFKQKSLETQTYEYFKAQNEQAERDKRTRFQFFGLSDQEMAEATAAERDDLIRKASSGKLSEAENIALSRWVRTLPFDTAGLTYAEVAQRDRARTAGGGGAPAVPPGIPAAAPVPPGAGVGLGDDVAGAGEGVFDADPDIGETHYDPILEENIEDDQEVAMSGKDRRKPVPAGSTYDPAEKMWVYRSRSTMFWKEGGKWTWTPMSRTDMEEAMKMAAEAPPGGAGAGAGAGAGGGEAGADDVVLTRDKIRTIKLTYFIKSNEANKEIIDTAITSLRTLMENYKLLSVTKMLISRQQNHKFVFEDNRGDTVEGFVNSTGEVETNDRELEGLLADCVETVAGATRDSKRNVTTVAQIIKSAYGVR